MEGTEMKVSGSSSSGLGVRERSGRELAITMSMIVMVCLASQNVGAQSTANNPPQQQKAKTKHSGFLCMHGCGSTAEAKYDLQNKNYSGEKVRGPRNIVAQKLNVLRYNYQVNS